MELKYTRFQKIIELITIILLLLMCTYIIISWNKLPNKIPAHYNAAGIVDRLGTKTEILIIPIINIILYALLTVISFFPSIWNIPVKTNEKNKKFVYLNLKTMLIVMKMEMVIVFSYIMYCDLKIQSLKVWFLPLFIIIFLGTIIYYIVKISIFSKNTEKHH